jgi:hypothetical protein
VQYVADEEEKKTTPKSEVSVTNDDTLKSETPTHTRPVREESRMREKSLSFAADKRQKKKPYTRWADETHFRAGAGALEQSRV